MRAQGWGKIVNLSSMGGRFTLPGGSFYHATKHAVEALSDALRFELQAFGINVIVIEPGLIRSNFGSAAASSVDATEMSSGDDPYAAFNTHVKTTVVEAYEKGAFAKLGGDPDSVAKVIERAIATAKPKTRYTVTPSATLLLTQRKLMSDGLWDAFLKTQFPIPGKN